MLSACDPVAAAVAVLDLREGAAPAEVRSGVAVSDTVDLPAELQRRCCSVLLVLSEHADDAHEQRLRVRLARTGVQVCWVRLPAAGAGPDPLLRDRMGRLQSLMSEASSLLETVSAGLAQTADREERAVGFDLSVLSAREHEVLAQVRRGHSNKEIGQELVLSPHTVGNHLRAIYRKLGVSGRHALLARLAQR